MPDPMTRSQFVDTLQRFRDIRVWVVVPTESGREVPLQIDRVVYNPAIDVIEVVTEVHLDGPDEPGGDSDA